MSISTKKKCKIQENCIPTKESHSAVELMYSILFNQFRHSGKFTWNSIIFAICLFFLPYYIFLNDTAVIVPKARACQSKKQLSTVSVNKAELLQFNDLLWPRHS